jgi:MoaA/NifB/PqqE/SkfB family radical SAM enzyme
MSHRFRFIGFHGWGEPLLNKDLFEMVQYAASMGVYTSVITNGTLLLDRIEEMFSSQLDDVVFGVYESSRLKAIEKTIEALKEEREVRGCSKPKIFVDITMYNGDKDEVLAIIKRASHLGVECINVHRLFDLYGVDSAVRHLSPSEERELIKNIKSLCRRSKIKVILPKKHRIPCRGIKYCTFITWDGYLTPCCFLPNNHLGNVLNTDINDILKFEKENFVRNMGHDEICKECIM